MQLPHFQSRSTVVGLGDHLQIGIEREQVRQPNAHDGVVIDEHQADLRCFHHESLALLLRSIVTRIPNSYHWLIRQASPDSSRGLGVEGGPLSGLSCGEHSFELMGDAQGPGPAAHVGVVWQAVDNVGFQ